MQKHLWEFFLKYGCDIFKKSVLGKSCTQEFQSILGNEGIISSDILIIDSPGIFDSEKTNEEIIKKLIIQLKQNFAEGLNCILMFFNGSAPRFD